MDTIKVQYNNYDKKWLEAQGALLKPYESKSFVVLNRKFDAQKKRPFMAVNQNVPITDTILYKDDFIEIAALEGYKPDGSPRFKKDLQFYRSNQGIITCDGSKPEDVALYAYLKLCRWNQDNKGKKGHSRPKKYIFKENDVVKRAEKSVKENETQAKAIALISDLENDTLQEYCRGLKLPVHSNMNVMKESLMKFAKKNDDNAKIILKMSNETEIKFTADIVQAEELDIIKMEKRKWRWAEKDGDSFHTVTAGKDPYKSLINYFFTEEGQSVYEQIILQINDALEASE